MTITPDRPPFATEETLNAVRREVYARLMREFGNPQLADELSHDALTSAYEEHLEDPGTFAEHDLARWCCRWALWRAVDRFRRLARLRTLPEDTLEASFGVRPLRENAPPERWERCRLVQQCVSQLPEPERRVLQLTELDGLTNQEAGAVLFGPAVSREAAGLRVWRLRQKAYEHLRPLLVEAGLDPTEGALPQAV